MLLSEIFNQKIAYAGTSGVYLTVSFLISFFTYFMCSWIKIEMYLIEELNLELHSYLKSLLPL